MREHHLAERLARLRGSPTKGSSASSARALQGRLDALSGGNIPEEDAEEEFNSRLASLVSERDGKPSSADDLNARLAGLSTSTAVEVAATTDQTYKVPEDFSEEWQDLDDLLESALERGDSATAGNASVLGNSRVDKKLNDLDALLKAPAKGDVERADEAGDQAHNAMEAFLRGAGGAGTEQQDASREEELGEEEERLLQMVSDQVRLEGHGITDRASLPLHEPQGDMWLPLVPTGRPEVFPTGGSKSIALDAGATAGLIAQQAMDEARLDGEDSSRKTGVEKQQQHQLRQSSSSWCCVCSEDATLRCKRCEAESGQDEPELFCARCFKEGHRDDPDMQAHRPQALSRGLEAVKEEDVGRKGFRGWRRRK